MTRQRRDERRRGVVARLTPRDEAMLRGLARLRLARTRDLIDLAFHGVRADTGARRIRRLFDAGFLANEVGERSEENQYRLGPEGRAWAEARGLPARPAPRGDSRHHLLIVRAWTALAATLHDHSCLRLTLARPDWELREEFGSDTGSLIPDLLVELSVLTGKVARGQLRIAIEVDLATERPPTLREKLVTYERLRGDPEGLYGWRDFGLVILTSESGTARLGTIRGLLENVWGGWWLICDSATWPQVLLDAVSSVHSPPLTASPCRKGRGGAASADCSTLGQRDGTGH